MKIDYYNICAAVELVTKTDVFDHAGYLFENKVFYIKNYFTQKFCGRYRLHDDYPNMPLDYEVIKFMQYYKDEVNELLKYKLLYKITVPSENHEKNIFFTIKTAFYDDLLISNKRIKNNVTYYIMENTNTIHGPHIAGNFTDANEMIDNIDQGKIFIPALKQLFEPYKLIQSA